MSVSVARPGSWCLVLLMVSVVLGVVAAGCGRAAASGALPYYADRDFTPHWSMMAHRVGAFSLVSQTGATLTDRDLAGHLHVASFIYTRCSAICPVIVSSLQRVEAAVAGLDVLIVSYTVTPEVDTPTVLAAFGRERGIDPSRWKLVTGDKAQIYRLARDSYFSDDERLRKTLSDQDAFLHTEKVVLVDRTGRLRGIYNSTQPFDMERLVGDIRSLEGH